MQNKWRTNMVLAVLLSVTKREKDKKLNSNVVLDLGMKT